MVDKQKLIGKLKGPVVALNVPLTKHDTVDYESLDRYVNHLIKNEAKHLLMTYGSTEYGVLADDEIYSITEFIAARTRGKLNFIGASKCWSIAKTVDYMEFARKCGADAVKVQANIFTAPMSEETLYQYHAEICKKSDFPIWLYTGPVNGTTRMAPATIARIANEFPNVIGMKTDGEMMYLYYDMIMSTKNIMMVAGGQFKPMLYAYRLGSKASLCAVSPILPKVGNKFYECLENNDYDTAVNIMQDFEKPIIDLAKKVSPWLALAKGYLYAAGLFETPNLRCPGITATPEMLELVTASYYELCCKAEKLGLL